MLISTHFQKFFFGVVCPQIVEKALERGKPMMYQHPLTKEWYLIDLNNIPPEEIYQLFKLINPYYPKYNNLLPVSTKILDSKQLTEHIKWIERWVNENGIELPYIAEEWERVIREAGIVKD